MKKYILGLIMVLLCGNVFAQKNTDPLPTRGNALTEDILRKTIVSSIEAMRVINPGAKATGGRTDTVSVVRIDSIIAPGTNIASWIAVIHAVDCILDWDTNRSFTGLKRIYQGETETTSPLNKAVLPKIYFRLKSGQTGVKNYAISTYSY